MEEESWYVLTLVSILDPTRENKVKIIKALRRHLGWSLHKTVEFLPALDDLPLAIRTGYHSMTLSECEKKLMPLIQEIEWYGGVARIDYDIYIARSAPGPAVNHHGLPVTQYHRAVPLSDIQEMHLQIRQRGNRQKKEQQQQRRNSLHTVVPLSHIFRCTLKIC